MLGVNNVTTAGSKAVVSAAKGNKENFVKFSTCWICRPTGNVIDHKSKDNGSYMLKRFDYVDLQGRLKGLVAFGGSLKGGTNANIDEGQGGMKTVPGPQYVLLPFLTSDSQSSKSLEDEVADDAGKKN
ncbi:hypothetical protein Tco_0754982 [Tanacetum coccineum]